MKSENGGNLEYVKLPVKGNSFAVGIVSYYPNNTNCTVDKRYFSTKEKANNFMLRKLKKGLKELTKEPEKEGLK